jgi:hypothetical protein
MIIISTTMLIRIIPILITEAIYLCVSTDCTLKNVCNNPTHPDTDHPKIGNNIVGTEHAPEFLWRHLWYPAYQEKTKVLIVNPYTTEKDVNLTFHVNGKLKLLL